MDSIRYSKQYSEALKFMAKSDLHRTLHELRPKLAEAAQKEYDAWDQSDPEYGDPELGFGGLCQNVADAMGDVLNEHGIDFKILDNGGVGEQHVWVAAHDDKHAYHVDIDPYHYESGGGYNWKKKPGVQFTEDHVDISPAEREHLDLDEEDDHDGS